MVSKGARDVTPIEAAPCAANMLSTNCRAISLEAEGKGTSTRKLSGDRERCGERSSTEIGIEYAGAACLP